MLMEDYNKAITQNDDWDNNYLYIVGGALAIFAVISLAMLILFNIV